MNNLENINKFQSSDKNTHYNFTEELEEVLLTLSGLMGIIYEVIGNWVWISGETKEHKDTLKEIGCKWAAKKETMVLPSRGT